MDDLTGLNKIMGILGPEFGLIVSDRTGAFPGARGLAERLDFIFRWSVVNRGEVGSGAGGLYPRELCGRTVLYSTRLGFTF